MPLLRSYVAYVCGARTRGGRDRPVGARPPIAHREKIPKSIRYTVDYILFNKLEVFINNQ